MLAEGADDIEERVTKPEVHQTRLDSTAPSAEATERLQDQAGEERQQEHG